MDHRRANNEMRQANDVKEWLRRKEQGCCARLVLLLASLATLGLSGIILLYPAFSYQVYDVWRLPSLDCSHIETLRPEASEAIVISGIVAETTKKHPPPAPPKRANLFGSADYSSDSSSSLGGRARQLFQRALETDIDGGDAGEAFKPDDAGANVLRDGFRAVLFSSGVLIFISLLGIALFCRTYSHRSTILAGIYVCLGLPVWVLLVFVSVIAYALRDQADDLVLHYWDCIRALSPLALSRVDHPTEANLYHHVDVAANCCILAAVLLATALIAVAKLIGLHRLLRQTVIMISTSVFVLGVALLAAGTHLYLVSTGTIKIFFDYAILGLGTVLVLASVFGLLGAAYESLCLLRCYAAFLILLLLAMLSAALGLSIEGPEAIDDWLDEHWVSVIEENVVEITRSDFSQLLNRNMLGLVALLVALVMVMILNLLSAGMLHMNISLHGPQCQGGREMQPLSRSLDREESVVDFA